MLTTILLFDVIAITLLPLLVYYAFKRFDNSKSLFLLKDIQQNLNFRGAYKTLTLLLLLSSTVLVKGYEKYTNVKIYVPAEKSQLLDLIGLLEIDHYHEHDGAFNYTVAYLKNLVINTKSFMKMQLNTWKRKMQNTMKV